MSIGQIAICIALFLTIGYIGGTKEAARKAKDLPLAERYIFAYKDGFESEYVPGTDGWLTDLTRHYFPNASDEYIEDYVFMDRDEYMKKYNSYHIEVPYWEYADE